MAKDKSTTKVCSISGCGKREKARGWCSAHWKRWRVHGDPLKARGYFQDPEEALAFRTERDGDCLKWTGATGHLGYGVMQFRGSVWPAHRVSWTLEKGETPKGADINHKCWNPACVNVDHLEESSRQENSSYRKGPNFNSTSGVRNVYWDRDNKNWRVVVASKGVRFSKSGFLSLESASEYAEHLRNELNGGFAGNG